MSSTNFCLEIVLNNAPKVALVNAIEKYYDISYFAREYSKTDLKSLSKESLSQIIIKEQIDFNRFETQRKAEMKLKRQLEKDCFKIIKKEVERRFNKKCDEVVKMNLKKYHEEREELYCKEEQKITETAEKLCLKLEINEDGSYNRNYDEINYGNPNLHLFKQEKRQIVAEYNKLHAQLYDKYYKVLNKEAMLSIDVLKIQMEVQQEYDSKTGAFDVKECPICYELTNNKINGCFHSLCQSCFDRLPTKRCPLCRNYCELI